MIFGTLFSSGLWGSPIAEQAHASSGDTPAENTINFDLQRHMATEAYNNVYWTLKDLSIHIYTPTTDHMMEDYIPDAIQSVSLTYPSTLTIDTSFVAGTQVDTGIYSTGNLAAPWAKWISYGTTTNANYVDKNGIAFPAKTTVFNIKAADASTYAKSAIAEAIIGAFRFKSAGSGADVGSITMNFSSDEMVSWIDDDGYKHFYKYYAFTGDGLANPNSWYRAYNLALSKTYNGLNGYLVTITSAQEQDVLGIFLNGKASWGGGTRIKYAPGITSVGQYSSTVSNTAVALNGIDMSKDSYGAPRTDLQQIGVAANGKPDRNPIPELPEGVSTSQNGQVYYFSGNAAPVIPWYWCAGPEKENRHENLPTQYGPVKVLGVPFYSRATFGGATNLLPTETTDEYPDDPYMNPAYDTGLVTDPTTGELMFTYWFRNGKTWTNPNGTSGISTGTVEPNSATTEDYLQPGWNGSPCWNDKFTGVPGYFVEFSEGWAEDGGGTYTAPKTEKTINLPTAVDINHIDIATGLAIHTPTIAPSSILDYRNYVVGGGTIEKGAFVGANAITGYTFASTSPEFYYNAASNQNLTYYYTRNAIANPVTYNVEKQEFGGYKLKTPTINEDYGGIRLVTITHPQTLTVSDDGDFTAANGWKKSIQTGVTTVTSYIFDGYDGALLGKDGIDSDYSAAPEDVQTSLAKLVLSVNSDTGKNPNYEGPEDDVTGNITVGIKYFNSGSAAVSSKQDAIPQPITVKYLKAGTSIPVDTAAAPEEVKRGLTNGGYTILTHEDVDTAKAVEGWKAPTTSRITIDGVASSMYGSATVPYDGTAHTVIYYYIPTAGYTVGFETLPDISELDSSLEAAFSAVKPQSQSVPATGTAKATEPAPPAVAGYKFDGWYDEADNSLEKEAQEAGTEFDFETPIDSVEAINTTNTLYAHWSEADDVTVTFNIDGSADIGAGLAGNFIEGTKPNDRDGIAAPKLKYNGVLQVDSTPLAVAAQFLRWTDSPEVSGGKEYTVGSTRVDDDVTLYAHWSARPGLLNLIYQPNAQGGTTVVAGTMPENRANVQYNEELVAPFNTIAAAPISPGYVFSHWNLSGSSEFTFPQRVTTNTVLVAQWTAKPEVAITFDWGSPIGGAQVDNMPSTIAHQRYNDVISDNLNVPAAEGNHFLGWKTEGGDDVVLQLQNESNRLTATRFTEATKLVAQWSAADPVSLTFHKGRISDGDGPDSASVLNGTMPTPNPYSLVFNSYLPIDLREPVVLGYAFTGWWSTETGFATHFTLGQSGSRFTTAEQDIYARWDARDPLSVTFNLNLSQTGDKSAEEGTIPKNYDGGSGNNAKVVYNDRIDPLNPVVLGYTFDGWYTTGTYANQNSGTKVDLGLTGDRITSNLQLYAKWTETGTRLVAFDKNPPAGKDNNDVISGTFTNDLPSFEYGAIIPSGITTSPEIVGYKFLGWSTQRTGGSLFTFDSDRLLGGGQTMFTLYAQWQQSGPATVSFKPNAVSGVSGLPANDSVVISTLATKPSAVPVREGYSFVKWTLASGDNSAEADFFGAAEQKSISRIKDDTELYASWKTEEAQTVTYYKNTPELANEGDIKNFPAGNPSAPYNSKVAEPATDPTLVGYQFGGWYKDVAGTIPYDFDSTYVQGATNIYAKWIYKVPLTVSFTASNAVAGTVPTQVFVPYGSTIPSDLSTPIRAGRQFAGWYTAAGASGDEYVLGESGTVIYGSANLFAHWTTKGDTITATYSAAEAVGGTVPVPVADLQYGGTITRPEKDPVRIGHKFLGWYIDAGLNTPVGFADDESPTYITEATVLSDDAAIGFTLYAKWAVASAIALDYQYATATSGQDGLDYGDLPENESLPYTSVFAPVSEPYLSGYEFSGYYTDPTEGVKLIEGTTRITGAENGDAETPSIAVYARFTKIKNTTIAFSKGINADGVVPTKVFGMPEPASVKYNGVMDKPEDPTAEGYRFLGWYKEGDTEETYGDKIKFRGEGTETRVTDSFLAYAKWAIETDTVTITFDANDAEAFAITIPSPITGVHFGGLAPAPSKTPKANGKIFAGWYTSEALAAAKTPGTEVDFTSHRFAPAEGDLSDDVVLYAGWNAAPNVTVTYDLTSNLPNGQIVDANGTPASAEAPDGSYIASPVGDTPTNNTYIFVGWYTEATGGSPVQFGNGGLLLDGDTTIYARWMVKSSISVEFSANNADYAPVAAGTIPQAQSILPGTKATEPLIEPIIEGREFIGWFLVGKGVDEANFDSPFDFDTIVLAPDSDAAAGEIASINNEGKSTLTLLANWKTHASSTLTFDANATDGIVEDDIEGLPPASAEVLYNALYSKPADPSYPGREFLGWFTDAEDGELYDFTERVKESADLYAHWSGAKGAVSVTFDLNDSVGSPVVEGAPKDYDGEGDNNPKLEFASLIPTPSATPIREGYRFTGWTTEKNGNTAYNFNTMRANGDTVIYAKWVAAASLNVTYLKLPPDGASIITGTTPSDTTIAYASKVTEPEALFTPKAAGYKFAGWRTSSAALAPLFDFNARQTDDVTLFPSWVSAADIAVSFNANAPEEAGEAPVANLQSGITVAYDGTLQSGLKTPTLKGYKFSGWALSENGNSPVVVGVTRLESSTPNESAPELVLYATWELQAPLDVSFDANVPNNRILVEGTVPETLTGENAVIYGTSIEEPSLEPIVEGHEFIGWFTEKVGGTEFKFADSASPDTVTENITLHAHWSGLKADVTVGFRANDAAGSRIVAGTLPEDISLTYNAQGYSPSLQPIRVGYQFNGWFDSSAKANLAAAGDDGVTPFIFTERVSNTVSLYASWISKSSDLTFAFNANDAEGSRVVEGTLPEALSALSYNTTISTPARTPIRVGYVFDGWYTTNELDVPFIFDGSEESTRIVSSGSAYAKWTIRANRTVSFDANNAVALGSTLPGSEFNSVPYGDVLPINIPVPVAPGYQFAGWFTERTGGTEYIPGTTRVNANVQLYAQWGAQPTSTVHFSENGANAVALTLPADLAGVKYNATITKPVIDPVASGKRFVGWYKDPAGTEPFNFTGADTPDRIAAFDTIENEVVTAFGTTLYAKWEDRLPLTVTYEFSEPVKSWIGSARDAIIVDVPATEDNAHVYNTPIDAATSIPIVLGYEFAGWAYLDENGAYYVPGITLVTKNVRLTAQMTEKDDLAYAYNKGNAPTGVTVSNLPGGDSAPYNSTLDAPENPQIVGYQVEGWYTTKPANWTVPNEIPNPLDEFIFEGGEEQATRITKGIILYANWVVAEPTTLTFAANDNIGSQIIAGSLPGNRTVAFNGTATRPSKEPRRPGFEFNGWYESVEAANADSALGTNAIDFATAKLATVSGGTKTLYAGWKAADDVAVTFDFNLPDEDGIEENVIDEGLTDGTSVAPYDAIKKYATITPPSIGITGEYGELGFEYKYEFDGWYTDASNGTKYDSGQITENTTLYAHWTKVEADQHFVHYYGNAPEGREIIGTLPATEQVADSNSASAPTTEPVVEGYVFGGWYEQEQLAAGDAYDFETPVTDSLNLYAKWTEYSGASIDVIWHANADTDIVTGIPQNLTGVTYNTKVSGPADGSVIRAGYTLVGWYTDLSLDSQYLYSFDAEDILANRATAPLGLYAKWEEVSDKLDVSFVADGANNVPSTEQVASNGFATKPETDPWKTGFAFKGWYTTATGDEKFNFEQTRISSSTIIYAQFTADARTFTAMFENYAPAGTEIATAIPDNQTYGYNGLITKPSEDPIALGYSFGGWRVDTREDSDLFDFNVPYRTSEHIYPSWVQQAGVNVTFASNEPAEPEGLVVEGLPENTAGAYNFVLPQIDEPTLVGYTFDGWYDAATDGNEVVPGISRITSDIVLYARWIEAGQIAVTFALNVPNGATVIAQPPSLTVNVPSGGSVEEPAVSPELTSYEFVDWYEDDELTIPFNFLLTKITAATTIYAGWSDRKADVTITFNGGEKGPSETFTGIPAPSVIPWKGIVTRPSDPERSGPNEFKGWYTAASGGQVFNFDERKTADATVYAQWTPIVSSNYTISFDLNRPELGGFPVEGALVPENIDSIENIIHNDPILAFKPADPTFVDTLGYNYSFVGWYITSVESNNLFEFDTAKVTATRTLVAGWTKPALTVSGAPEKYTYKVAAKTKTVQLTTNILPSSVTWKSSNTKVAAVDANGLVTFKGVEGNVTITATDKNVTVENRQSNAKTITVVNNVTKVRTPLATVYIQQGKKLLLPVGFDDGSVSVVTKYTFKSSNVKVLTVDAKGNIKAKADKKLKKAKKVTVTITATNGKTGKVTVNIVPKAIAHKGHTVKGVPKKLEVGKTALLSVKLKNAKATGLKITYTPSSSKIISVDKAGRITAKTEGTAFVKVKVGSKTVKTAKIKVMAAVKKLTASNKTGTITKLSLKKGKTDTIKITATDKDGKTIKAGLTWKTSNKKIVSVDKKGKVKGVKKGSAKITATSLNGKKVVVTVTVK
ncbi:MAG: InlB B-repeat-containing protein [Clostridiales Family XIII bacterium]|nr:InlB B-repeat-containing protein [Clostridiales Family XIII bacterium]